MKSILTLGVPLVQAGKGSVKCNRDCVICGSVGEVCKLVWVQGVWNDGVDVSNDQSFKAFHGYRCECYWAKFILTCYLGVIGHRDIQRALTVFCSSAVVVRVH